MIKKIMISAGEVSGDIHGKYLVRELKKLNPNLYIFGLGSEKLLSEGVDVKFDLTKRGTIGLLEALPNIVPIYFIYLKMVALLKQEKPDLVLLIDSQGINLPLAKAAKKLGLKTVYYIAPQEWLWGTARGVKNVVAAVDQLIAIFQREHDIYQSAGGQVQYFGHPLIDIVKAESSIIEVRKEFLGETIGPVISICPGSRRQEIKGLFPILLKAAQKIKEALPQAKFLIPAASTDIIKMIFDLVNEDFRPKAVVGHTYDLLAASDLALCTSGTINLEASILATPNIMVYKLNPLTFFIGKKILKIGEKLPFYSMPNILLEEKVIPELVMGEAKPDTIALEAIKILTNPDRQQKMKASFARLKTKLGAPGVIAKAAKSILCYN
jgi:lipid-A-disaccharide synthase